MLSTDTIEKAIELFERGSSESNVAEVNRISSEEVIEGSAPLYGVAL
jgi:hypothetical protein